MSLHIKFHLQPPVSLTGRDRKNQPAFECQVCGKVSAGKGLLLIVFHYATCKKVWIFDRNNIT